MDIVNETPFTQGLFIGTGPERHPILSIIVKATFTFPDRNGAPAIQATNQLPIATTDEYYNDNFTGSTRIESDLVPFKTKADLVVVGNAYTPEKKLVRILDVALRVGRIAKIIRVFGDRFWFFPTRLAMIPVISDPEPFSQMPLVYERTFGGIDFKAGKWCKENLVGRGFIGKKSKNSIHEMPLPNLEDPKNLITSWDSHPRPVGFGFYGRSWQPRAGYSGINDENYQLEEETGLPKDFRFDFYNGAHPDLQVPGYLQGDELVEMRHFTPDGYCSFRLPGLRPVISVTRQSYKNQSSEISSYKPELSGFGNMAMISDSSKNNNIINSALDTLVIFPDERVFYLVWRGVCTLQEFDVEEIKTINIKIDSEI